jgi:hypothetical protein
MPHDAIQRGQRSLDASAARRGGCVLGPRRLQCSPAQAAAAPQS